jgi:hypothetical protein
LRRKTLWLTAGALAAGVVVGIGAPALLGSDTKPRPDATATDDTSPSSAVIAVQPDPEVDDEIEIEVEPERDDGPAEPSAVGTDGSETTAPAKRPRARTKRTRKPRRSRTKTTAQPAAASRPREYLPPSRRGQ